MLPVTKTTPVSILFPNGDGEHLFTLQEFPKQGATESVGFHLYEASVLLSQYLAFEYPTSSSEKRKRVLELGSGSCALAGLTMTRLGHQVTFSDLAGIIPSLTINVERNAKNLGDQRIVELPWGDRDQAESLGLFDLVIGADVVYQREFVIPLLETILWCAKKEVLIAAEVRDESLVDDYFVTEAKRRGFHVKRIKAKAFPKPFCEPPKSEYLRIYKLQKTSSTAGPKSASPTPSSSPSAEAEDR